MTVVLLGVFSETGRSVLSLSSVSMSLTMIQRHFPRLTAAVSTLLSPTLESLLLLLLLSLTPLLGQSQGLCPHFIQVSTQPSISKRPFPVKRNKTLTSQAHICHGVCLIFFFYLESFSLKLPVRGLQC